MQRKYFSFFKIPVHCFSSWRDFQLQTQVHAMRLQWLRCFKVMQGNMSQLFHSQWWMRSVKAAMCYCKVFLIVFVETVGARSHPSSHSFWLQQILYNHIWWGEGVKKKKSHWYHPFTWANVCIPLRNAHPCIWETLSEVLPPRALQTVILLQAVDNSSNICEHWYSCMCYRSPTLVHPALRLHT